MSMATPRYPASGNPYQTYRQQQIMTASPAQLLLMTYDYAIQGCKKRDLDQAKRGLSELIDALNFDAGGTIAAQLFSLYEYSLRMMKDGNFDEALRMLEPLRQTWAQALAQKPQAPGTVAGGRD